FQAEDGRLRRPAMEHVAQAVDPFVFRFSIFVLAVFVGYYVVWSVTPALHTPLMSVTNAISSVIVVGALLAVGVPLATNESGPIWARALGFVVLVIVGLGLGGGIGAVIARRVPMTAMPELVAAFHSLVGMAAVLVAAAALYAPSAFDIGRVGAIHGASLIEMSLGAAIGAVTFTGSVIAFLKLSARMSGAPILLPLRHVINAALFIGIVALIVWFARSESHAAFWLL